MIQPYRVCTITEITVLPLPWPQPSNSCLAVHYFACTTSRKPPLPFSQSSITIVASWMVHGLYVECWPELYMQKLLPANHSMIVKCTMHGVLVEYSRTIHSGYCSESILCFLDYSWNNMQVLCSETIQPQSSGPTVVQNIARLLPCDIQSELQFFITIVTAYSAYRKLPLPFSH